MATRGVFLRPPPREDTLEIPFARSAIVRSPWMAIAGLFAVVAATACSGGNPAPGAASATATGQTTAVLPANQHGQNVNVTLVCTAGNVAVTVAPWTHHEAANGSFNWHLTSAQANSISITPKDPNNWPITPAPPITVQAGQNAPVTLNATTGDTIRYTIAGSCTDQGGETHNITIDPDVVVD